VSILIDGPFKSKQKDILFEFILKLEPVAVYSLTKKLSKVAKLLKSN
jgi:hypothetical protein